MANKRLLFAVIDGSPRGECQLEPKKAFASEADGVDGQSKGCPDTNHCRNSGCAV
jgi:hypothetical protein